MWYWLVGPGVVSFWSRPTLIYVHDMLIPYTVVMSERNDNGKNIRNLLSYARSSSLKPVLMKYSVRTELFVH